MKIIIKNGADAPHLVRLKKLEASFGGPPEEAAARPGQAGEAKTGRRPRGTAASAAQAAAGEDGL